MMPAVVPRVDALIVGAGWAGLWTLHKLRQKGLKCLCVEAYHDVGGVWLYTEYPGCRNETETPVYQFSARETWENWHWKERFPAQKDVHAYMRHVAETLDLLPDIIFNGRVSKARWNEKEQHWVIFVDGKLFCTTRFYIPCTGYAGKKYIPTIKGLKTFKHRYHTSEYPSGLSVKDKRVGVLGTGSSGIQCIETIGPEVEHLTVFQRTPNLANPRHQQKLTLKTDIEEKKTYLERYSAMNETPTGLEVKPLGRCSFEDSPKERQETYESLWAKGAQNFWFGGYDDMLSNQTANDEAYAFWRDKTRKRIKCPIKRDILAPRTPPHAFGTRRPSLESSYFEVFNQHNVDLVDLTQDQIKEVTTGGIQMKSGAFFPFDILILATGYDFGIGSQLAIETIGRGELTLNEKWGFSDQHQFQTQAGIQTYLGIACAGFPNMLMSCGPHSPAAFGITPRLAELQGEWLADCIAYVREKGGVIETNEEAEKSWKEVLCKAVEKNLIAKTDGWYMGNNIPGRRKEPLFWFGGVPEYMALCHEAAAAGYDGFVIG